MIYLLDSNVWIKVLRDPTASFFCPRFFCQPRIHGFRGEGKFGKKIEGKKMGGECDRRKRRQRSRRQTWNRAGI